jgi:hypothetical protein
LAKKSYYYKTFGPKNLSFVSILSKWVLKRAFNQKQVAKKHLAKKTFGQKAFGQSIWPKSI